MTNKYLTSILVLSALAASLGIAGCGGDESAEASLTKAQFSLRADLICSKASERQFEKATKYLSKHPGAKEADMIELAGIPPLEKALEKLRDLPPPPAGLEARFDAFTEEFERALEAMKEEPLTALSTKENPFKKANRLARNLEIGDCSGSP